MHEKNGNISNPFNISRSSEFTPRANSQSNKTVYFTFHRIGESNDHTFEKKKKLFKIFLVRGRNFLTTCWLLGGLGIQWSGRKTFSRHLRNSDLYACAQVDAKEFFWRDAIYGTWPISCFMDALLVSFRSVFVFF